MNTINIFQSTERSNKDWIGLSRV